MMSCFAIGRGVRKKRKKNRKGKTEMKESGPMCITWQLIQIFKIWKAKTRTSGAHGGVVYLLFFIKQTNKQ